MAIIITDSIAQAEALISYFEGRGGKKNTHPSTYLGDIKWHRISYFCVRGLKDVLPGANVHHLLLILGLKKYSKNFPAVAKLYHSCVLTSLHSDLLSYTQGLPLEGRLFGFFHYILNKNKVLITPILLPAGDSMFLQELIPRLAPPWLSVCAQGWGGHILRPLGLAEQLLINEIQEFHWENSFHPAWKWAQLWSMLALTAGGVLLICSGVVGLKSEVRSPIKGDFLWLVSLSVPVWGLSCSKANNFMWMFLQETLWWCHTTNLSSFAGTRAEFWPVQPLWQKNRLKSHSSVIHCTRMLLSCRFEVGCCCPHGHPMGCVGDFWGLPPLFWWNLRKSVVLWLWKWRKGWKVGQE